jgi:hypothetical protein
MKTILVITDFSQNAKNAGEVAVRIAGILHADILLLNAVAESPLAPSFEHSGGANQADLVQNDDLELLKEANRLEMIVLQQEDLFHKPAVATESRKGHLAENAESIIEQRNVFMAAMHINEESSVFREIIQIINSVNCPVLLIPQGWSFRPIRNIVFVTEPDKNNIKAVKFLARLSIFFDSRIHIFYISKPQIVASTAEDDEILWDFRKEFAKLNSMDISLQNLSGNNIETELEEFDRWMQADILSLIYKQHRFLGGTFNENYSGELISHYKMPVLLIPNFQ